MQRRTGFDGWWEALQFDKAVTWLGRYVENKVLETDERGKPIYSLDGLLEDQKAVNDPRGLEALAAIFGAIDR